MKLLVRDQWRLLREIRLAALRESPDSFLATYEDEREFDKARWHAEFDRGSWLIGQENGRPVSLLGCTRLEKDPAPEFYLEYLWVSPQWRHQGIALKMLGMVIERLRADGVRTAYLWVLDGNDAAVRLYRRLGFVSSNNSQPLTARPGRSELRMRLELA